MVSELVQDMREYPVVAVVDMEGIPGQQVQSMRAGLRAHAKLKMTKNNLMLLAIEEAAKEKPEIIGLKDSIHGQCAIVTTDIDPFKLFKKLEATMTPAPAKEGQLAPFDIVVPKGPTPFGPGPIIGELQKIGLPAAIEAGKIVVKKDTTLVKEGEPIPGPVAAMLPKLEILPMVVGMDLRAAYEDGVIYSKDVLDIPEDYYSTMFATAAYNALALGVSIAFPTKETIVPLIAKAFRETMNLSVEAAIPPGEGRRPDAGPRIRKRIHQRRDRGEAQLRRRCSNRCSPRRRGRPCSGDRRRGRRRGQRRRSSCWPQCIIRLN